MALIDKLKSICRNRFIDGVIGIFDISNYMISTIYEEDETEIGDEVVLAEAATIKIASINGGILNIVCMGDESETLFVVGRIVEEADSHDSLQMQIEMLYAEEEWDDEGGEEFNFVHNWNNILKCKHNEAYLSEVLDEVLKMLHMNEDFVISFADAEVPKDRYKGTEQEVRESFKKMIGMIESKIIPKMHFE